MFTRTAPIIPTTAVRHQAPPILQLLLRGLSPAQCLSLILHYSNSMSRHEIDAALSFCAAPTPH